MTFEIKQNLKKQISISAYCLIALCLILCIFMPHIHAKQPVDVAGIMSTWMSQSPQHVFYKMLGGDGSKLYKEFCGIGDGGYTGGIIATYNNAYNVMKTVGFLLTISAALGKIFQKFERGQEGTQMVIGALASVCIAGMVIMNIDLITGYAGEMGRQICLLVLPSEDPYSLKGLSKAFLEYFTGTPDGGYAWSAMGGMQMMLPGVANMLGTYGIYVLLISKFLEVGIMRLFAPLCIYDVYDEGLRSTGAMFIKRILAAFIAIAMAAVCAGMSMKVGECMVGAGGAPINALEHAVRGLFGADEFDKAAYVAPMVPTICTFTVLKAMNKTDDIAKGLMGIH